ncbi:S8 family serine peptidase [Ideonella sp. DXS22W]|uniref:S8 family serine peptidase n=1 Tax=Pseudaquabacterium inlustre TaxID=2984192 RepID=A0ABU9CFW7_9BURK
MTSPSSRRRLRAAATLATLVLGALATPAWSFQVSASSSDPAAATAGTDRLIIKYSASVGLMPSARGRQVAESAATRHGVRMSHWRQTAAGAQVYQLSRRMSHADAEALASTLRATDATIEYAEPDRLLRPQFVPNDAMYAQQWALFDATGGVRAPAAWDRATGSGITVAVIDTGVRPHVDLAPNLLGGYDFITDTKVSNDGNARDADALDPGDAVAAGFCYTGSAASNSSWHGTHVAGIVAAAAGNGAGVAGLAFNARVLPLRALGRCGGYTSDIADAITWAVGGAVAGLPTNTTPARVINLSLGGTGSCGVTTQNAINTARAAGAVVVVAAGNSNSDATKATPANCSGVVVVAATGKSGAKASYSNYGSNVTLAAPGGDSGAGILSTLNAGTSAPGADSYAAYMGTSMATPVVSGVAALMLSANAKLTPDQVASLLKSTARAFPASCSGCGAGIVDASAAVAAAVGATATTPTPVVTVLAVNEVEPNNTLAQAQAVASTPANVSGTLSTTSDLDHFKVAIPAGKSLTATLTAGSTSGFGLTLLNTSGQTIYSAPGVAGRTIQVTVSNSGATAATVVLRVLRSTGAAGAYKLALSN